jgi:hypothetical protein
LCIKFVYFEHRALDLDSGTVSVWRGKECEAWEERNGLCDMFICEKVLLDCQVGEEVRGSLTWTAKVVVVESCVVVRCSIPFEWAPLSPSLTLASGPMLNVTRSHNSIPLPLMLFFPAFMFCPQVYSTARLPSAHCPFAREIA